MFATVAEILDKQAEADDILVDYETVFTAAQSGTTADAGQFVVGVLWGERSYTVHSTESFIGSFVEVLGRSNAIEPAAEETQYLLDLEGLASVNPASIVVLCNPGDQAFLDDLASEPVWQALEAAQNNRVYTFNRNLWSKARGITAFRLILQEATEGGLLSDQESTSATC